MVSCRRFGDRTDVCSLRRARRRDLVGPVHIRGVASLNLNVDLLIIAVIEVSSMNTAWDLTGLGDCANAAVENVCPGGLQHRTAHGADAFAVRLGLTTGHSQRQAVVGVVDVDVCRIPFDGVSPLFQLSGRTARPGDFEKPSRTREIC